MAINEVYPNELIEKVAEELKKIDTIKPPMWASLVKTGAHKARPPRNKDWWYQRAAAVLRTIAILGPIGVSKLRTKYGGKKRRGHKPPEFRKGSGSILRKVLQQLDKAELTKLDDKSKKKGRVIAPKGNSLLDRISVQISKSRPKEKVEEKKAEKPVEKKVEEKVPTAEKLVKETKKESTEKK